jgi:hypothetical protein
VRIRFTDPELTIFLTLRIDTVHDALTSRDGCVDITGRVHIHVKKNLSQQVAGGNGGIDVDKFN